MQSSDVTIRAGSGTRPLRVALSQAYAIPARRTFYDLHMGRGSGRQAHHGRGVQLLSGGCRQSCPPRRRAERRAGYSDIDYNGHVNNARYVQWIQDILPMEPLLNAASLRLDINYLAELRHGEKAGLASAELMDPVGFHVEGTLANGGAPCFRSRLTLPRG